MRGSPNVLFGLQGDEIRNGRFLPVRDREAVIAYAEIVLRRSNRLEGRLLDRDADIRGRQCEQPNLAEGCHLAFNMPKGRLGSKGDFPRHQEKRPLQRAKQPPYVRFLGCG